MEFFENSHHVKDDQVLLPRNEVLVFRSRPLNPPVLVRPDWGTVSFLGYTVAVCILYYPSSPSPLCDVSPDIIIWTCGANISWWCRCSRWRQGFQSRFHWRNQTPAVVSVYHLQLRKSWRLGSKLCTVNTRSVRTWSTKFYFLNQNPK